MKGAETPILPACLLLGAVVMLGQAALAGTCMVRGGV